MSLLILSLFSFLSRFHSEESSLLFGSGATSNTTFFDLETLGSSARIRYFLESILVSCLSILRSLPISMSEKMSSAVLNPRPWNAFPRASKNLRILLERPPVIPCGANLKASAIASSMMISMSPSYWSMYASKRVLPSSVFRLFRNWLIHCSLALFSRIFHSLGLKNPSSFKAWMASWRRVPTGSAADREISISLLAYAPSAVSPPALMADIIRRPTSLRPILCMRGRSFFSSSSSFFCSCSV